MAHYDHKDVYPMKAASAFGYGVVLTGDVTTGEQVFAAATTTKDPLGLSIATVPSAGNDAALLREGVGKAIAAASLGAFTRVAPASTNGALGPIAAVGQAALASGGAIASAGPIYSVGIALKAAAAGEIFPVLLDPRQIV